MPGHDYPALTLWACWDSDGTEKSSSCNTKKMIERLQSRPSKEHTTRRSPDYYQENQGVVEGFYSDYYDYYGDSDDVYPDIPPRRPQNQKNDYFGKAFQVQEIKQQQTALKHGSDYIEEAFQERTTGKCNLINIIDH